MLWSAWAVQRAVGGREGGRAVRVHAHSLVALSWKLDHRLAIVSRSAKFIINTARAAARCQTERESGAELQRREEKVKRENREREKVRKESEGCRERKKKHLDYLPRTAAA